MEGLGEIAGCPSMGSIAEMICWYRRSLALFCSLLPRFLQPVYCPMVHTTIMHDPQIHHARHDLTFRPPLSGGKAMCLAIVEHVPP